MELKECWLYSIELGSLIGNQDTANVYANFGDLNARIHSQTEFDLPQLRNFLCFFFN